MTVMSRFLCCSRRLELSASSSAMKSSLSVIWKVSVRQMRPKGRYPPPEMAWNAASMFTEAM